MFAEALGDLVLKPGDRVSLAVTAENELRHHTVIVSANFKD